MPNLLRTLTCGMPSFETGFGKILEQGAAGCSAEVSGTVASIIRALSSGKGREAALLRLVRRHDGFDCGSLADLEVPPQDTNDAEALVPKPVRNSLREAADRIRTYHEREAAGLGSWRFRDRQANEMGMWLRPVDRAAVYAPGGTALYPSSVLMNAVPARVAGVGEIVLLTPPGKGGRVAPVLLHAAALAGVDRIFRIGGAQAIASAAFGNSLIPRVDVVAGPGNAYVAEAKRQVFGRVGIDSLAGPSEVMIIADDEASPDWIAADLLAQAEHDAQARVFLATSSSGLLKQVQSRLAARIRREPRRATIRKALASRGCALLAHSMAECCELADRIAPEHLQVMTRNAAALARRVRNAGAVFIGVNSPTVFGDYCAGTNHVLPTSGSARFASPLGVHTFMKRTGFLKASAGGAAKLAVPARRLALEEGLPAHARSAGMRVRGRG